MAEITPDPPVGHWVLISGVSVVEPDFPVGHWVLISGVSVVEPDPPVGHWVLMEVSWTPVVNRVSVGMILAN